MKFYSCHGGYLAQVLCELVPNVVKGTFPIKFKCLKRIVLPLMQHIYRFTNPLFPDMR